jgi:hypothetical protein
MAGLEDISKDTPVVVYSGHVYRIMPKTTVKKELKEEVDKVKSDLILIDNKTGIVFELKPLAPTRTFEDIIEKDIEQKVLSNQGSFVKENARLKEKVETYKQLLEILVPELDTGMGVTFKDDSAYVFLKVEPYILKSLRNVDEDNGYFLFPEAKVALRVGLSNNRISVQNYSPIVFGRYDHPFVGAGRENSDLCFGDDGIKDRVFESMDTTPKKIMYILKKTKQLLQTGYINGVTPRASVESCVNGDYNHGAKRISLHEAESLASKGIQITNREIHRGGY